MSRIPFGFLLSVMVLILMGSPSVGAVEVGARVHVVLEAEEMALQPPMVSRDDPNASMNRRIEVPNGGGSGGAARTTVSLPVDGNYYLFGRARAPSGADNSFFVDLAGQRHTWHIPTGSSLTWHRVTTVDSSGVSVPLVYSLLQPGEIEVAVVQREDGTGLDQLIITNDANFVPSGHEYASTWFEAESGSIQGSFLVSASELASAGSYLVAPNGTGNSGKATYTFAVSRGGNYTLQAKVFAPTGGDNSFFLTLDQGVRQTWHVPVHPGWKWQTLTPSTSTTTPLVFSLAPGSHTLLVEAREDGTAIDRLVISGEPSLNAAHFEYLEKLRPIARKHLDSPVPPLTSSSGFAPLHYGIASLWLNERTEEGNALLEDFVQDGSSLVNIAAVLAYFMFVPPEAPFVGRISPNAADNLAAQLWEYTFATSSIENALAPPNRVLGSENLQITQNVVNFLTAMALSEDPTYGNIPLKDGYFLSDHRDAWRGWFPGYLDWRARKGVFVEVASPTYAKYTTNALFNLYAWADDPDISGKARMLVDLMLTDWAQDQVSRVRGGGKCRNYLDEPSWYARYDAYNGLGQWLFGGTSPGLSQLSPFLLGVPYFTPSVTVDLANRVLTSPFEVQSRRPGPGIRTTWTDPVTGIAYLVYDLDPVESDVRTVYVAPEYILGSITIDSQVEHTAISGQNRWHGAILTREPDARVFLEVEPEEAYAEKGTVYDAHIAVQAGRCMVAQKNRNEHKYNGRSRVYFARVLDRLLEDSGWIFAEEGDAFVGVKVVSGGYSWISPSVKNQNSDPALNYIVLNDEFSPVILETGTRVDYGTLEAFAAAMGQNPLSFEDGILVYESLDGTFTYPTQNHLEMPSVDGEEPPFDMPELYRGGYIDSDFDSGIYTLQYAGQSLTLDITDPSLPSVRESIPEPVWQSFASD